MRRLSQPINVFGLTLGPVALLLLLSSCALLLQELGCPVNLQLPWVFGRANRPWPIQFAVGEFQSLTIASFFNEHGGRAFPWGPRGSRCRAAQADSSAVFGVDAILTFLEEDGKRQSPSDPKSQRSLGSPIYFVGVPANSVTILDSETAANMGVISVGNDPRWIEMAPDHSKAYVSNFGSDSVSIIDTATMAVERTIDLAAGSGPIGVAPGPDGQRLYVVNSAMNSLSAIDLMTGDVTATSDAGNGATHVAVSPDGQLAYVANQDAGTVSVFDMLSMDLVTTIVDIPSATSVVFEDRGRRAFVTGGGSGLGRLYTISTSAHAVSGSVQVGRDPVSVRLSPYGNFLFVANQGSGSISIIDARTETVRETVSVGQSPADVAAVL